MGHANFFLGIEIMHSNEGISISQHKYIIDILQDASMLEAKAAPTPLPISCQILKDEGTLLANPESYRRIIGRLLYLVITRPDLSFAVQQLNQFVNAHTDRHMKLALRVLKYLKGTVQYQLKFTPSTHFNLAAFCDSNWDCCVDTRRSITGYCIYFGNCLISWKSKKQTTVTRSYAEAEYRVIAATVAEVLWISYILKDLQVHPSLPVPIYCDNHAVVHILENPILHKRTKHIRIDCHFIRIHFSEGLIKPIHIRSQHQIADICTKALGAR